MVHRGVAITGVGAYLPGEKIPTDEIEDYLGVVPGAELVRYGRIIHKYAGIKFRHFAVERNTSRLIEDSASLAAKAAKSALSRSGLTARDVDLLILTTTTPPYLRAGLAKDVRIRLGIETCATYDLWGACTGLQQGLTIATAGIRSGMFNNALICGVELPSTSGRRENYACDKITPHDALLRGVLGDGAGALVLTACPQDEDGVLFTMSGTEGSETSAFHREAGGSTLPLNTAIFSQGLHHWQHDFERLRKSGRTYFLQIVKQTLASTGLSLDEVDFIVPAAANFGYFRANEFLEVASRADQLFWEQVTAKIFFNFPEVGNIPSAAIYVALNELYETSMLETGMTLLLPSIEGATWGWGASAIKWQGVPANRSMADRGSQATSRGLPLPAMDDHRVYARSG